MHARTSFVIESGTCLMRSGISSGLRVSLPRVSNMSSCQPNPMERDSSLASGRLSWPMLSLYAHRPSSGGKNIPYPPEDLNSTMIFSTIEAYSLSSFFLFRMQCPPLRKPSQPKQKPLFLNAKEYMTSWHWVRLADPMTRLEYPTATVSSNSSEPQPNAIAS